jgi:hypothetical protein
VTKITNTGLKEFEHLAQWTSLNVSQTKVTNAGLKELEHLAH